MTRVNFIPMHLLRRRQLHRRGSVWALAGIVYLAICAAAFAAWRVTWTVVPQGLAADTARLTGDTQGRAAETARVRAQLTDVTAALRVSRAMNGQPDWGLLLAVLAKLRHGDVVLRRLELSAPGEVLAAEPPILSTGSSAPPRAAPPAPQPAPPSTPSRSVLKLQGLGPTQAAVSQFVLRLEQTGLFESIDPVRSRESFEGNEVVAFKLECRLATPGSKPPTSTQQRQARAAATSSQAAANAAGSEP